MKNTDTAAVVVTFNRLAMLKECIAHLLAADGAPDILIINNASTDGTGEYLADLQKTEARVFFRTTTENLGGAGGFSLGTEWAVREGYQYLWLMDDDSIVDKEALMALRAADRELDGHYGFLASTVRWTDGSLCMMNRQHLSLRGRLSDPVTEMTPVIMSSFVGFFVKAETVREVGLPIKAFFIWSDDLEYARRISRREQCFVVPESIITHAMASNEKVGIESASADRLWRFQYLYRNEVYLYRREGFPGILFLLARVMLHTARVVFSAKPAKVEKIKTIWSSFLRGWRFHPSIEIIG